MSAETPAEKLQVLKDYITSDDFDDEGPLTSWEIQFIDKTWIYTRRRELSPKETNIVEKCYERWWKEQQKNSYGTGSEG